MDSNYCDNDVLLLQVTLRRPLDRFIVVNASIVVQHSLFGFIAASINRQTNGQVAFDPEGFRMMPNTAAGPCHLGAGSRITFYGCQSRSRLIMGVTLYYINSLMIKC